MSAVSQPGQAFEHAVDDPRLGAVTLAGILGEEVAVSGVGIPHSRIVRVGGEPARTTTDPPIGTRDPDLLEVTVDDVVVGLATGRGRLARSSYRVTVLHDGLPGPGALTLTPRDPHSSRLVRGRRYRGGHGLATLTRGADGDVGLVWEEQADADPLEASLGYLLASAFDTGAELAAVRLLTDGADLLFPG